MMLHAKDVTLNTGEETQMLPSKSFQSFNQVKHLKDAVISILNTELLIIGGPIYEVLSSARKGSHLLHIYLAHIFISNSFSSYNYQKN